MDKCQQGTFEAKQGQSSHPHSNQQKSIESLARCKRQYQCPLKEGIYRPYQKRRGSLGPKKTYLTLKQLGLQHIGKPVIIKPPTQKELEKDSEFVVFQPNEEQEGLSIVYADEFLAKNLRPHQRDGVKFIFECCSGLAMDNFYGCILSDGMGLGKTFQSIASMWILLTKGVEGKPTCSRAMIICPSSLVLNWGKEITKWLQGRIDPVVIDDTKAHIVRSQLRDFTATWHGDGGKPKVIVMSYTTFRMHKEAVFKIGIDLVICDEAHMLKNKDSQVTKAMANIPTKRRLLLSGTPVQNDLLEFYAMINIANPDLLGDSSSFHKVYERPILAGRDADATAEETVLCKDRSKQLVETCNKFMLRRTNALLKQYLPPRVEQVVFCRLAPLQMKLLDYFMKSKAVTKFMRGADDDAKANKNGLQVLPAITAVKKLCCHPEMIYQMDAKSEPNPYYDQYRRTSSRSGQTIKSNSAAQSSSSSKAVTGFEGSSSLFRDDDVYPQYIVGACQMQHSGKLSVLEALLKAIRAADQTDKVVIVSNYTATLTVIEKMCVANNWKSIMLDGSLTVKKRLPLVEQFNDARHPSFVFLLSSKAGGTGLNIIGANRLVLFDPDWNPANDQQATARVWREGQTKPVWIYRFLATGSLEEKIYQRQIAKEGLSRAVVDDNAGDRHFSRDELRQLFQMDPMTQCETYTTLRSRELATSKDNEHAQHKQQTDEESLLRWAHFPKANDSPDAIWKQVPDQIKDRFITFMFSDHLVSQAPATTPQHLDDDEDEDEPIPVPKHQQQNIRALSPARKPLQERNTQKQPAQSKGAEVINSVDDSSDDEQCSSQATSDHDVRENDNPSRDRTREGCTIVDSSQGEQSESGEDEWENVSQFDAIVISAGESDKENYEGNSSEDDDFCSD